MKTQDEIMDDICKGTLQSVQVIGMLFCTRCGNRIWNKSYVSRDGQSLICASCLLLEGVWR